MLPRDHRCARNRRSDQLARNPLRNTGHTGLANALQRLRTPSEQTFDSPARRVRCLRDASREERDPVVPMARQAQVRQAILVCASARLEPRRDDKNRLTQNTVAHQRQRDEESPDRPLRAMSQVRLASAWSDQAGERETASGRRERASRERQSSVARRPCCSVARCRAARSHGGCCVIGRKRRRGLILGSPARREPIGGRAGGMPAQAAVIARWRLGRSSGLWLAVMRRHSLRYAARPRRWKRSMRRLNFVLAKTGSISSWLWRTARRRGRSPGCGS